MIKLCFCHSLKRVKALVMIVFFVCCFPQFLFPAFEYKVLSAQSAGVCGIKTVIKEEAAAVFYNPALIPQKTEISMFHATLYNMNELANSSLAFSTKFFTFGYNIFGENDFYKEETVVFATNFRLTPYCKLGISYKSMFLDLGEMDTHTRVEGIDLGLKVLSTAKSCFGIMLSNINRPKIGKTKPEEIYRDFSLGYRQEVISNLWLMLEGNKVVGFKAEPRFAVEAQFFDIYTLRTGLAPDTEVFSIGFGLSDFLDYAYSYHHDLDATHYLNLKINFS
ncbi:MAG: hypothetical protein GY817_00495 [bacterium]|nr:hypothetical protein [bacterium]